MLTRIKAAKCIGIDAVEVTVEVNIDSGIGIHLVGLADAAVKESLLRTTTALTATGYRIPGRKIVINLAPADMHKSGSGYDLPLAIGIIAASGQADLPGTSSFMIMGELGLDGSVRDIPGALVYAEFAARQGYHGIILPVSAAKEAVEAGGIKVYGVQNLGEAVSILESEEGCANFEVTRNISADLKTIPAKPDVDFSEIIGQESAKRGMEIAAAGGHNIIMIGPPGSGKTSLAKALVGILPPMSREEALMTGRIHSVAGRGSSSGWLEWKRPFRAPHYSASPAAIIGGGSGGNIIPGEVSLACNGVLFLDEFGQIPRSVTEALRGPMEDREVTISRMRTKIEFPASFMLVAASNPCPCGYFGEGDRCSCSPYQRAAYMSRLSGPIMDRMDIQVRVRPVPPEELMKMKHGESSMVIADRVRAARQLQARRFAGEGITTNAEMSNAQIKSHCPLAPGSKKLLAKLMDHQKLSMRAYFRIIKVARSIADLAGSEKILDEHILEAASFRMLDRIGL